MKNKLTISTLILMAFYFFICFLFLGLLIRITIEFYYTGTVDFNLNKFIHLVKMSSVPSLSITLAAFIFNKIDEYNGRKKPPVDSDK